MALPQENKVKQANSSTCKQDGCTEEKLDASIRKDSAPILEYDDYCYQHASDWYEQSVTPEPGDTLKGDGNCLLKGIHDGEIYHVVKTWTKNGDKILTLQPDDGRKSELHFKESTLRNKTMAADGRGIVFA